MALNSLSSRFYLHRAEIRTRVPPGPSSKNVGSVLHGGALGMGALGAPSPQLSEADTWCATPPRPPALLFSAVAGAGRCHQARSTPAPQCPAHCPRASTRVDSRPRELVRPGAGVNSKGPENQTQVVRLTLSRLTPGPGDAGSLRGIEGSRDCMFGDCGKDIPKLKQQRRPGSHCAVRVPGRSHVIM